MCEQYRRQWTRRRDADVTRKTLVGWSGALAASALLLTGCAASSAPAAGGSVSGGAQRTGAGGVATGKDACTLLTRAEVEKALGEPATGEGTSSGAGHCEWTAAANDGSDTVNLDLDDADVLKQVVTGNGGGGTVPTESISGVGDEAIYANGLKILYVRKGTTGFTIQIATVAALAAQTSEKDNAVTLAQAVLGRL